MPSTISSRFLVLSDTRNFEFATAPSRPFHLSGSKVDVLVHCGQIGSPSAYKNALQLLGNTVAELELVIARNHFLDLDRKQILGKEL